MKCTRSKRHSSYDLIENIVLNQIFALYYRTPGVWIQGQYAKSFRSSSRYLELHKTQSISVVEKNIKAKPPSKSAVTYQIRT